MSYKFIPHTSDLMVEANAKTFAKALEDVAMGMFTHMGEESASAKSNTKDKIEVKSKAFGLDTLVVTFLSDIIAQCEIERFVPSKIKVRKFDEDAFSVEAELIGERGTSKNVIKAVTYHELKAEKTKDGWTIRVLFDI